MMVKPLADAVKSALLCLQLRRTSASRRVSLGPCQRHRESRLTHWTGNICKGPVDENGQLKDAALLLGIKLDLEAEIHLTARVRGDVTIGLY